MKQCLMGIGLLACAIAAMADYEVTENVVLAADADWRDRGLVTVSEGVSVDLNGYSLEVSNLAGKGTITSSKLGVGYIELKYLDATGAQYIDTGVIPNTDSKYGENSYCIEADLASNADAYQAVCSACYYDNKNAVGAWTRNSSQWTLVYNNSWKDGGAYTVGDRHQVAWNISLASRTITVDGAQTFSESRNSAVGFVNVPLYLGARNNGNAKADSFLKARIWGVKIYRPSTTLVRDYVPAKRTSDGAVGFYDRVNHTFQPSATATSFVEGEAVDEGCAGANELVLDFRNGTHFNNSSLALAGSLRLVLTGDGQYTSNKSQSYYGGNEIRSGWTKSLVLGGYGLNPTIICGDNGVLNVGSNYRSFSGYDIVMAGHGTIYAQATVAGTSGYNKPFLSSLTLQADATIHACAMDSFNVCAGSGRIPVRLNGNRLTLKNTGSVLGNAQRLIFFDVDVPDHGTIRSEHSLLYPLSATGGLGISAPQASLEIASGCKLGGEAAVVVSNFVYGGIWSPANNPYQVTVFGSYAPKSTADGFPVVQLGDGNHLAPTLDLSDWPTAFDGSKLGWVDNSTVMITLGKQTKYPERRVIAWSEEPANVDTLQFMALNSVGKLSRCPVDASGVYLPADVGTFIIIR